jgi:hypothetical protein
MICDYCQGPTELVGGVVIYPHLPELSDRQFYYCQPCQAWVGCHQGSTSPMGRLANKELRQAKMRAHDAFDTAWRGRISRRKAYRWLAEQMPVDRRKAHIGMFDVEQCARVVELAPMLQSMAEAERAHEDAKLKQMLSG